MGYDPFAAYSQPHRAQVRFYRDSKGLEVGGALLVIVADSPTYTRPDGVLVTSIAALGP